MSKFISKVVFGFLIISLLYSCSTQEDVPIADFDISRIQGEYSVNLNIDYAGTRPAVSVFNGYLSVEMISADDFELTVDFPGDYLNEVFTGTVLEKIVSSTNSAIGGVSFNIQETSEFMGNPDQFTIKTRSGETKSVYAYFIEQTGGEVQLNLELIEKKAAPSIFEFEATK